MAETIITEHYNGKIKIIFYPESHRYRKEGEKTYLISATSVTGIIDKSRPLMIWASKLTKEYAENYVKENNKDEYSQKELLDLIEQARVQYEVKRVEAASLGSKVHEWAEQFARAKIDKTAVPKIDENADKRVIQGINAFLDWYNSNKVKFLEAEKIVYSKKHNFTGIVDCIAMINGKKTLVDYKTAKDIYIDYELQLGAYEIAYTEEFGELQDRVILQFCKETGEVFKHEIKEENVAENKKAFLNALALKKVLKARSKWEQ